MGVDLESYRAAIGLFNVCSLPVIYIFLVGSSQAKLFFLRLLLLIRLLASGKVHPNTGPRQLGLSLSHLNARSLSVSDKFTEISALVSLRKFDIFAV